MEREKFLETDRDNVRCTVAGQEVGDFESWGEPVYEVLWETIISLKRCIIRCDLYEQSVFARLHRHQNIYVVTRTLSCLKDE